jgi:hypothetical protein
MGRAQTYPASPEPAPWGGQSISRNAYLAETRTSRSSSSVIGPVRA